jgi:cytochrome P450
MSELPPGPSNPRQTFVQFQANPLGYLRELADIYGGIVHYRLVTAHVYLINDPALIREVLVEKADKFERTDHTKETLGRFLGNGLLLSAGDFHRQQRQLIQPVFTPSRIESYAPAITDQTLKMIEGWQSGEVYDIAEAMMALTLSIVSQTIFGADLGSATDEIGKALTVFQQDAGQKLRRHDEPITDEAYQSALDTVDRIIQDLISTRRNESGDMETKRDLLSLLAAAVDSTTGEPMSDHQIRDEAMTLVLAGHDTTANALSWTFYLLAQYPEVEARLLAEIQAAIPIIDDKVQLPTVADLYKMPYLEMVLKESMRLYPPAWLIGRRPIEPVEIGGYTIPPTASIAISTHTLHRTAAYFSEPDRFNPERFAQEPTRYSYIPFGGGPHVCIGQSFAAMESALILATILPRFHFELLADQVIEPEPLITLRPKNGIQVRITERERESDDAVVLNLP